MRNSLGMRNSLVAAAFIAAVLMLGASTDKAAAMMGASPAQLGFSNADNGLVQKAALVCGRWGCRRVWAGRRVAWGHRVAWGRRVAWRRRVRVGTPARLAGIASALCLRRSERCCGLGRSGLGLVRWSWLGLEWLGLGWRGLEWLVQSSLGLWRWLGWLAPSLGLE